MAADPQDLVSEDDPVGCMLASALKDHLDGKKVYFDIRALHEEGVITYHNQEDGSSITYEAKS